MQRKKPAFLKVTACLVLSLLVVPVIALWLASLPMVQQRLGEYAAS